MLLLRPGPDKDSIRLVFSSLDFAMKRLVGKIHVCEGLTIKV